MYSLALVLEDLSLTEKKSRLHTVENLGAEDRERLDADKADLCSLTTMLEALCFPEEGPVVQTVKNLAPWDRKILDADYDALGSLSQVLSVMMLERCQQYRWRSPRTKIARCLTKRRMRIGLCQTLQAMMTPRCRMHHPHPHHLLPVSLVKDPIARLQWTLTRIQPRSQSSSRCHERK